MRNLLCWLGIHRCVFLTKTGSPWDPVCQCDRCGMYSYPPHIR
jgi:hypothetical protein